MIDPIENTEELIEQAFIRLCKEALELTRTGVISKKEAKMEWTVFS